MSSCLRRPSSAAARPAVATGCRLATMLSSTVASLAMPAIALAHPGHASDGTTAGRLVDELTHLLSGPGGLGLMLGSVLLLAVVAKAAGAHGGGRSFRHVRRSARPAPSPKASSPQASSSKASSPQASSPQAPA